MTQTLNLGNIISPNGASVVYIQDGENQYIPYTIEFTNEPEEVLRADGIKYTTEAEDTNNTDTTTVREILDSKITAPSTGNDGQFLKKTSSGVEWGSTTDTKDTAGVTPSKSKLYLIGAADRTTSNSQTFSSSGNIIMNCNSNNGTEEGSLVASKVYGAVWNDYAEYRDQINSIEPGYCVASTNDGKVYKTIEKFQACDGIVSDTYGFAIGETDTCKTPLAVSGRVLAYCEGNPNDYSSGDTVCAGPEGKICKMTREEIREWPDRIVGIVSEIPTYDTWGTGNVPVNGRIWIKVK